MKLFPKFKVPYKIDEKDIFNSYIETISKSRSITRKDASEYTLLEYWEMVIFDRIGELNSKFIAKHYKLD